MWALKCWGALVQPRWLHGGEKQEEPGMESRIAHLDPRFGDECEFKAVSTNHFHHTVIQVRQPVSLTFWPY